MKLEVGMYVRTDEGYISKILDFREHYTKGKRKIDFCDVKEVEENFLLLKGNQCPFIESIDYSIPPCYPSDEELEKIKSHIVKASHNIIDLIKAKDVLLIKDKQYDDIYKAEVVLDQDNNLSVINYDCDKLLNLQLELYKGDLIELVSVLTHEQFENNCFRIGD